MSTARSALLERIIEEAAAGGLADRSLREIAEGAGTSHRMLIYHFVSRAGLVAAVVETIEAAQRDLLVELSAEVSTATELMMALWRRVSAPELRPFVRLFFECVAATGGEGLTDPWLEMANSVAQTLSEDYDADQLRLGVAVTRGLLIDVLATGDADAATRSMERFIEMWQATSPAAVSTELA
ncbi:MAG: TetR/AcrR family transcriptional regulator [Acidimicrobiia bacterium]|nr:TetR/AcrR family transcriptional regulator [Acidimicrobiia bacterium]